MATKGWKLALVVLIMTSCVSRQGARTIPGETEARIKETEAMMARPCYVILKRAFHVWNEIYSDPGLRPRIAAAYLRTSILLAVREKDLGMDNPATVETAFRLLKENPSLAGLAPYVEMAALLAPRTRGVVRDIDPDFSWTITREKMKKNEGDLRKQAEQDDFAAYLSLGWNCTYGRFSQNWQDPEAFLKLFPDSLLILYRAAICGEERVDLLQDLLVREPEFYEAHFHLGEAALREGALIKAEESLLKAYDKIPESPQVLILLAAVYFATEEYERCLDFYDRTIAAAPQYRDAFLGKAVCLSSMGRYAEAIPVLERVLFLGYWLIGESHYWLAWNRHKLGRGAEAAADIEQAKGRLPTNGEVFSLAGTISLERGDLDKAEKDFQESLRHSPENTESLFGLGAVAAARGKWRDSAEFYERAALALEKTQDSIRARLLELHGSPLSEERKTKIRRRREAQLEQTQAAEGSAFLNSATAWMNAGEQQKALEAAGKAALYPRMRERAEELIAKIRKGEKN